MKNPWPMGKTHKNTDIILSSDPKDEYYLVACGRWLLGESTVDSWDAMARSTNPCLQCLRSLYRRPRERLKPQTP